MRKFLIFLGIVVVALGALWVLGPRVAFDRTLTFADADLGDDLDAYLSASESGIDGIIPGAEKEIIWAGAAGRRTPWAIVYLHGFSASKAEIRPVPDRVAAALGANLYYNRMTGHGRDGAAMDAASAGDWWNDTAEALAIGRRLGERVIIIGTSTGVTMATLALQDGALSDGVAGLVGFAPNYRLFGVPVDIVDLPFARQISSLVGGAEQSWEPFNDAQGKWWTTTYPTSAALPMTAALKALEGVEFADIDIPALFLFADGDTVVDHARTREIAAIWGGGATIVAMEPGEGESPSRHVVTGDIMAPSNTDRSVEAVLAWIDGLK